MAASFFAGAHNFSVGEMNVKNVSGDYIDHSTKNVRNTYRGGNNYYNNYDQSYHDSSNHHYGNNYTTTNFNHGPVNNIQRVDNANFGTNYGTISQSTFDGPQQNYPTNNYYNAPVNQYSTRAQGGAVVNGDFNGTQINHGSQGPPGPPPPHQRPTGYGPRGNDPRHHAAPPSNGPMGGPSRRSPNLDDDGQYGPGPEYSGQRPGPVPVPGQFVTSDTAAPPQQYRQQQREQQQSKAAPPSNLNPWQPLQQRQSQSSAPPPTERVHSAPPRTQPNEERKERQRDPVPEPPAAFPPLDTHDRQHRVPPPSPPPRSTNSPAPAPRNSDKGKAPEKTPQKKPSWDGEIELRNELEMNSISYSSSSEADHGDGYGVGSGRQGASKEKEAMKEADASWTGDNLLLQSPDLNLSSSLLAPPPREQLPAYDSTALLTPTPVVDSMRKSAGSPAPSHKDSSQSRPAPNSRSLSPLEVGSSTLGGTNSGSKTHKASTSLVGLNSNASAAVPPRVSGEDGQDGPDHEGGVNHDLTGLHGLFPPDKKKKKNPVKKLVKNVFGTRKKTLD